MTAEEWTTADNAHCESGRMTAEEDNTNVETQQTQRASKTAIMPPDTKSQATDVNQRK